MPIGAKRSPEDELQDWARLQVRAGFLDEGRMRAEVVLPQPLGPENR